VFQKIGGGGTVQVSFQGAGGAPGNEGPHIGGWRARDRVVQQLDGRLDLAAVNVLHSLSHSCGRVH
jgi:hypothetical protein